MNDGAKKISTIAAISFIIQAVFCFGWSFLRSSINIDRTSLLYAFAVAAASIVMNLVPAGFVFFMSKNKYQIQKIDAGNVGKTDKILMTAGSAALLFSVGVIYSYLFPSAAADIEISIKTPLYKHFLMVVAYALIPAVVEELFYRYLISGHIAVCGKATAILISSAAFGLAHFSAEVFPYAFISGVVLGILYFKTGSILCTVIAHFLNNFTVYLFALVKVILDSSAYTALELITVAIFFLVALFTVLLNSNFTLGAFTNDPDSEDATLVLTPVMIAYGVVATVISIL